MVNCCFLFCIFLFVVNKKQTVVLFFAQNEIYEGVVDGVRVSLLRSIALLAKISERPILLWERDKASLGVSEICYYADLFRS